MASAATALRSAGGVTLRSASKAGSAANLGTQAAVPIHRPRAASRQSPMPVAAKRSFNASSFKGASFAPLPSISVKSVVSRQQGIRAAIRTGSEGRLESLGQSSVFKTLVFTLLAAGFAAFSYLQIAYTQSYYTQGLGVVPITSSQYSFVRSYGTSLIPLSLYSLYAALQRTTVSTGAKLDFALFLYGAGYGIPVLVGYLNKVVPQQYATAALLLTGAAALLPPLFGGLNTGNVFSGVADGIKKAFHIRGMLSFFSLVTTIIFFGQGALVYLAPTKILPPDLLAGTAREAVIIFARGVSAASLAATVAMASIKDIADNNKTHERATFNILNLGLILMSAGMLLVAYFNSLEADGLLATSPSYFWLRVGVSSFNILVLLANVFVGLKE